MVFSFFSKKTPEKKMVAKPAAVPRGRDVREDALPSVDMQPEPSDEPLQADLVSTPGGAADDSSSLDFSGFEFSQSAPDFQIEQEIDPVDAEAEEAAILYANGQDEAVRAVLENAVRIHHFGPGERLWMMLFDLYRLTGQKAAFDALGIDYARSFEKSPPVWRDKSPRPAKASEVVAGSLLFKGDLIAENNAAFEAVRQALVKNARLRLDMSKVNQIDAVGCGRLLTVLQQARKSRRELELLARDTLSGLVEQRIVTGSAENSECWLLLLELCQLQGQHEAFEELAINYAVTFEVSPPSWESGRVAAPEPVARVATQASSDEEAADAYRVQGDIKASRFGDLNAHADLHDPVVLDCAALVRMDFISAGALLNVLSTIRKQGKQIVFRHPNHLVAELFGVVGLRAVAAIIFAKH
ncbi:MAG: STAS domain-containing protein [Propionivibrio sp.]|nr:STAS domain-containing protein [Propionivibrio sp.]